jgi:hypothetical protein
MGSEVEPKKKKRRRKRFLILFRIIRAWWYGILFWKPAKPFHTECFIVWFVMLVLFFTIIPKMANKSNMHGWCATIVYIIILGYVNFGLKKLTES